MLCGCVRIVKWHLLKCVNYFQLQDGFAAYVVPFEESSAIKTEDELAQLLWNHFRTEFKVGIINLDMFLVI